MYEERLKSLLENCPFGAFELTDKCPEIMKIWNDERTLETLDSFLRNDERIPMLVNKWWRFLPKQERIKMIDERLQELGDSILWFQSVKSYVLHEV